MTASAYQSTSQRVVRRACSCRSKKSKLAERDLRHPALLRRLGRLQELRGGEAERPGEQVVREGFPARVVFHRRVVVGLAREGDPVLGAGQLLLQAEHV